MNDGKTGVFTSADHLCFSIVVQRICLLRAANGFGLNLFIIPSNLGFEFPYVNQSQLIPLQLTIFLSQIVGLPGVVSKKLA